MTCCPKSAGALATVRSFLPSTSISSIRASPRGPGRPKSADRAAGTLCDWSGACAGSSSSGSTWSRCSRSTTRARSPRCWRERCCTSSWRWSRLAAATAGATANRDSGIIASGMDLTFFAIVIMSAWVVGIAVAGLVMALRPGGIRVRLAAATGATGAPPSRRDEILLGGDAEVLGNVRGRVEAVQLRPESHELQSIELGTGLGLETQFVPASAILSADGRVVRLAESWIASPDGSDAKAATLRRDMSVKGAEGKRLGRLRLVCFDPASGRVTSLVIAGRGTPSLRLVPMARVQEVGPGSVVTDLRSSDWMKLQPFATDWEIRQAVMDQLAADPTLRAAQRSISVEVHDQVVTLAGYVADDSQTEQLARLIRSVPGVQQIDRRLITDEELAGAVTEAIRRDPAAAAAQVQVSAHDGTVDITGEAPDRATVRAIERVAGQVPGVQVLHNVVAVRKPAGLAS